MVHVYGCSGTVEPNPDTLDHFRCPLIGGAMISDVSLYANAAFGTTIMCPACRSVLISEVQISKFPVEV